MAGTHAHRLGQVAHLQAAVVEVILARHRVAAGLQDIAQRVADYGAAPVSHSEWAGWVGRDKLDLRRPPVRQVRVGVALALGQDLVDVADEPGHGQAQVDEAGARNLGRGQHTVAPNRKVLRDSFGDLPWGAPRRSGQLHGDGGGEIAVLLDFGPLDRDLRGRRRVERGQGAALLGLDDGVVDQGCKLVLNHGRRRVTPLLGGTLSL